jgi:hypothetical protein
MRIDINNVGVRRASMPTGLDQNVERVFVDESGGTDLPLVGQDSPDFYVIAGIFYPETDHPRCSLAAEAIVRKYAGLGELKSSNLGSKTARRENILRDIAENRLPFYCLVVDKARIWRDSGLRWRPSFYKFLHRMFYSQIRGASLGIRVLADQYGRSEFMESFKRYMDDHATLFDSFEFAPSSQAPLLQIADVLAGTVRRVFMQQDSRELLRILGYPSAPIEEWPPAAAWDKAPDAPTEFDDAITGIALQAARKYVERHLGSDDEDDRLRAHAIRYLLFRFEQDPDEYILRAEITAHLDQATGVSISEQTLSTKVFADARDSDVIMASTDKGVKIPFGARDLRAWMARTESQVVPYLRRVEAARRLILIASNNQHDIVDPANFPALSKYLGNSEHTLTKPSP